jgi:hypothetical protein
VKGLRENPPQLSFTNARQPLTRRPADLMFNIAPSHHSQGADFGASANQPKAPKTAPSRHTRHTDPLLPLAAALNAAGGRAAYPSSIATLYLLSALPISSHFLPRFFISLHLPPPLLFNPFPTTLTALFLQTFIKIGNPEQRRADPEKGKGLRENPPQLSFTNARQPTRRPANVRLT